MTMSKLACKSIISPNKYHPRAYKVTKITPHHMAGNLSIEDCGSVFASSSRQASSNYGIGTDGRIACYVDENDAAWTSSNWENDNRAITIEVANTSYGVNSGTWEVSQAAWNSLVDLCVDICTRYGFRLEYTGNQYGSLTEHRMFASTACPGPYLHARMNQLASEVNARLEDDLAGWGEKIWNELTDTSDPTGRNKKASMRIRVAYMAQKQEKMQGTIDALSKALVSMNKKLDKVLDKLG